MAKWEKKQEYYYVPYQKVEEIVQCLVKWIWEKENGFIDEGKQHLFHYVERIPSDYCECMIEEVIEMTMKRLAVKIGVPMELKGIKTIEWNDPRKSYERVVQCCFITN